MKHIFFLLISLSYLSAFSQDGYVVTLEGDTISGDIKIYPSTYYDEVQIKNDGEIYEPISFENRKIIAKLKQKGAISLFLVRPENEVRYTTEVLYKNDVALIVSNIGFRKRLVEYFDDCAILSEGLKKKEINASDIDFIMETYNAKCSTIPSENQITTDFSDLKEFSQLLNDITSRIENNEDVPGYLVEALNKYSGQKVNSDLQKLIKYLENK